MKNNIHVASCPCNFTNNSKQLCNPVCMLFRMELRNQQLRSSPLIVYDPELYENTPARIIPKYKWWQNLFKWLKERRYCRVLETMANDPELTARRQKWLREAMLYGNYKPFEIWPHETPRNFWEKNYQHDIPKGFFEEVLPDLVKKGIIKP